ncbi:hypothetical protein ACSSVY_001275 [Roseovarius sp. MBR-51]
MTVIPENAVKGNAVVCGVQSGLRGPARRCKLGLEK